MAEVINLVSSSPQQPLTRDRTIPPLLNNAGAIKSSEGIFDIAEFEDDFPEPRANKRLKVRTTRTIVPDEIEFSSSAPPASSKPRRKQSQDVVDLLDLDINELFNSLSQPTQSTTKTENALQERSSNVAFKSMEGEFWKQVGLEHDEDLPSQSLHSIPQAGDESETPVSKDPRKARPTKLKITTTLDPNKEAKAAERAAQKSAKEAAKEQVKERKRLEKESQAQERQKVADLAEVNKARFDKKESAKQLIMEVPTQLRDSKIGNQLEAFMQRLEVELDWYEDEVDLSMDQASTPGSIIRWRRKVDREYDKDLDHYKPLNRPRIDKEKHILIHLPAIDFATIAAGPGNTQISEEAMKANLDAHVHTLQQRHPQCIPVYLIEGLKAFLRQNTNAKNRQFTAAARAAAPTTYDLDQPASHQTTSRSRKRKPTSARDLTFFTQPLTDTLTLHLQLTHPHLLIHHTPTPDQSAHWIMTYTQQLSLRPQKLHAQSYTDAHAGFCMESGQIKTADTRQEIFVRMLQELPRVTPSMAWGVVEAGFGGVGELVRGFRGVEGREGRARAKAMLEDVRKAVNRDGGVSERRLGPRVSRRLYRVFHERNEWVVDV